MGTISELVWTAHSQGDRQQWKAKAKSGFYKVMQLECKNEHGNEWELFFDDDKPRSLYFGTAEAAKDAAEKHDRVTIKTRLTRDRLQSKTVKFKLTSRHNIFDGTGYFTCTGENSVTGITIIGFERQREDCTELELILDQRLADQIKPSFLPGIDWELEGIINF